VAMALATLIHPLPPALRTFFRAAYYLPAVTSAVFIALVWKWMLNANPWGVFNYFIGLFGVEPLGWVSDPSPFLGSSVALWSVILSSVLTIPAVGVVLYSAALANIPRELYEAAESEGAGAFQKFRYITIPLLKPVTLYVAIIYTIAAFEVFERVYVMTGGGPGYTTHTIVYLIWRTAFRFTEYGAASAQAFLLFIVIATISIIQFRALRGEVEY
jgi:multiple sugar transport system permease protein